jgi:hypothetical protein
VADFCEQCAWEELGIASAAGYGDLANLVPPRAHVRVLCEGCGPTVVDHAGICQGGCIKPLHCGEDAVIVSVRAFDLNRGNHYE